MNTTGLIFFFASLLMILFLIGKSVLALWDAIVEQDEMEDEPGLDPDLLFRHYVRKGQVPPIEGECERINDPDEAPPMTRLLDNKEKVKHDDETVFPPVKVSMSTRVQQALALNHPQEKEQVIPVPVPQAPKSKSQRKRLTIQRAPIVHIRGE